MFVFPDNIQHLDHNGLEESHAIIILIHLISNYAKLTLVGVTGTRRYRDRNINILTSCTTNGILLHLQICSRNRTFSSPQRKHQNSWVFANKRNENFRKMSRCRCLQENAEYFICISHAKCLPHENAGRRMS
uniref:Uncharacterized protein n=1 Tax=Glossina brevipalpis TaxID=37001 RepID=A0A1A9X2S7_9MUSC